MNTPSKIVGHTEMWLESGCAVIVLDISLLSLLSHSLIEIGHFGFALNDSMTPPSLNTHGFLSSFIRWQWPGIFSIYLFSVVE